MLFDVKLLFDIDFKFAMKTVVSSEVVKIPVKNEDRAKKIIC